MGLHLSKSFASLDESFEAASKGSGKIPFDHFKSFVDSQDCLHGLNLTVPLLQRLFSELDPHKKGFINITDWKNAFKSFGWKDQLVIEIKNIAQNTFTDCESLLQFFLTFGQTSARQQITRQCFEAGVSSLTGGRFKKAEVDHLWRQMAESGETLEAHKFKSHFDGLLYRGLS